MATKRHQFILGLVVRKMREAGYKITAVDGDYPGLFAEALLVPPRIRRHRPDAMGVKKENGQVCIGEAKTEDDIETQRTVEQLQDFANLELNGNICEVVIGLPESSQPRFLNLMKNLDLEKVENIHTLFVPDQIINE